MDVFERIRLPWRTGVVTSRYPAAPPVLEPAVRGLPELDPARCDGEAACATACPTAAITVTPDAWTVDAGRCVMCGACARACPSDAIRLGALVTLAARSADGLLHVTARRSAAVPSGPADAADAGQTTAAPPTEAR